MQGSVVDIPPVPPFPEVPEPAFPEVPEPAFPPLPAVLPEAPELEPLCPPAPALAEPPAAPPLNITVC